MKSILISIKPEEVKKILSGEMVIETRNTAPKCELPCKVYIYCTNGYMLYDIRNENYQEVERKCTLDYTRKSNKYLSGTPPMLNRKVVAEFTLNKIDKLSDEEILKKIDEYKNLYEFAEIIPVSALKNDNIDRLIKVLKEYLPDNVKYFMDGETTTDEMEFRLSEMVREKTADVIQRRIGICKFFSV